MTMDLNELADRVEALAGPDRLKFGIWPSGGWVLTSSREVVSLFCELWNARQEVAAALRTKALGAVHTLEGGL